MGGFGSGRPWSGKPKVEQAMPLNVAKLFRDGHIRRGYGWQTSLIWTSSRDQSQTGSIGLRSWCEFGDEPDRIELHGTFRDKPFSQTIRLVSIPGTKGGKWWLWRLGLSSREWLPLLLRERRLSGPMPLRDRPGPSQAKAFEQICSPCHKGPLQT